MFRWGVENDIDYIAASFTRKAADVREIRDYAAMLLKEKVRQHFLAYRKLIIVISTTAPEWRFPCASYYFED